MIKDISSNSNIIMSKCQLLNIILSYCIFFCINTALAGSTEKFIVKKIEDASPPNEWMKLLSLNIHDEEFVSLSLEVYKEFPPDAVIKTNITYAGEELPQHEMLICDSFNEKTFGDDVKQCGYPQPGFPVECPFGPHKLIEIRDWQFPHYKIPQGTPPGPVLVNITFSFDDIVTMHINAEGEIVQDVLSAKAVPSFG